MISGYDYVLSKNCKFDIFINRIRKEISEFWPGFFSSFDNDDGIETWFFAKDRKSFDLMDDKGFFLENDEGPFMVMCSEPKSITLVIPDMPDSSVFCKLIFEIAEKCAEE